MHAHCTVHTNDIINVICHKHVQIMIKINVKLKVAYYNEK